MNDIAVIRIDSAPRHGHPVSLWFDTAEQAISEAARLNELWSERTYRAVESKGGVWHSLTGESLYEAGELSGATDEQTYEQRVERLERKYEKAIASIARAAIPTATSEQGDDDDPDGIRDAAREIVTAALLNDEAWAPVHATDISDIAGDAVERAWSER